MNALVTGGLGFIGSHLTERLLQDGHRVTVVDDLSTGHLQNLAHLVGHPQLSCYIDTIRNKELMERVVADNDVIFHLAAVVGVRPVLQDPLRCLETNIRGTDMLLEIADKWGVKVLLASSSEVYGKNSNGPMREDDNRLLGPTVVTRWIYATTKAVDECLGLGYWRERGLPVIVMRLFNVVGPRQTDQYGMVLPSFVQQALANRPITVYGDGRQVRSFTYISDTVNAMLALSENAAAVGEVFNIGSAEQICIADLAARVKEAIGCQSPIQYIPYEVAYGEGFEDTRSRVPDISKLKALVGYEPKIRMDEMIQRIIQYFQSRREVKAPAASASFEARYGPTV
jgi:UDP-glucose 4-epimerase